MTKDWGYIKDLLARFYDVTSLAVQLRRRYAVMKEAARARRR